MEYEKVGEHPESLRQSTAFQAGLNMFNVLVGFGILSLPYAFQRSGWMPGVFFLLYFCLYTKYTAKQVGACMKDNTVRSLPDMCNRSFGPKSRRLVDVLLVVELLFSLAVFLRIMSDHLYGVFPDYPRSTWSGVVAGLLFPLCLIDKLHLLSYLSLFSALTIYYVALLLFATAFFPAKGMSSVYSVNWDELESFGHFRDIAYSLGIHMAGYAGHAQFAVIYNSMKDTSSFNRVVDINFFFCFLLYLTFAGIGFVLFAPSLHQEVTLNLYDEAPKSIFMRICAAAITVNPISKFVFTTNTIAVTFEQPGKPSLIFRTTIVLSAILIDLLAPSFTFLCALIGAFSSYFISGIIPSLCYLCLCEISYFEKIFNYVQIPLNIILCLTATAAVIIEEIQS